MGALTTFQSPSPPWELFLFKSDPLYPQTGSQSPVLEALTALILPCFASRYPADKPRQW